MAALRAVLGVQRGLPTPPLQSRGAAGGLLERLGRKFYDVELALEWRDRLKKGRLRRLNQDLQALRATYGPTMASTAFVLSLGGSLRFEGQEHWVTPSDKWLPEELPELPPVVALDLSGTLLTYEGLENLASLTQLQHLDLTGCPQVDDWALSRLYHFSGHLQRLILARCPQVTTRGLATLHHLRNLRLLDLTGLQVASAGLVRILLEEELPHCQILGLEEAGEDVGTPPPSENGASPPPQMNKWS